MTGVFETALTSADGARRPGTEGPDRPYLSHFGLREEPFPAAASARAYFLTSASYQVLEGLRAALASGTPLMRVYGAEGVGKTLLAEMVPSVMTPEMEPVLLDAAVLGADPFVVVLRQALGMPETVSGPLQETLAVLAAARDENVSPVLVIDNAHLLGAEALQALDQLLTPAVPGGLPPMQVVLIGTPHLESLLASSGFPRLRRSGGYMAELVPFTRQEAIDYIGYRLRKAQVQSRPSPLFDDQAIQRLVSACCGNPRVLNVTCEAALLIAYADGADRVGKVHADRAVEGAKMPSRFGPWLSGGRVSWVAGLAGVLIGAGVTAIVISRGLLPLPVVSGPAPAVPPVTVAAAPPVAPDPGSPLTPASPPGAVPPEASSQGGADLSGASAPAAPEAPGQELPPTSAEAGDTVDLDVPEQMAPVAVLPAPAPAGPDILRGRTVRPDQDKVADPAPVDRPAVTKPAAEVPATKAVADRRPVEKGPPRGAEKPVVKGPEKVLEKPAAPRVVKAEPPPVMKPPVSRAPAEARPPERPAARPKPAPDSAVGTASGRQENGRWVWQ